MMYNKLILAKNSVTSVNSKYFITFLKILIIQIFYKYYFSANHFRYSSFAINICYHKFCDTIINSAILNKYLFHWKKDYFFQKSLSFFHWNQF